MTQQLKVKGIKINRKSQKNTHLVGRDETTVALTPPAERMETEKWRTVIYRTMNIEKKKEISTEVEEVIDEIRKGAIFYTCGAKYCSSEVKFVNLGKELLAVNATKVLKTGKWVLFPTYSRKRITRIRVGKIPPKIEVEWLAAAVLLNTSNGVEIL